MIIIKTGDGPARSCSMQFAPNSRRDMIRDFDRLP
jgi:hypothetical protein